MMAAVVCWTLAFWSIALFGSYQIADAFMIMGIGFMELNIYGRKRFGCEDDTF